MMVERTEKKERKSEKSPWWKPIDDKFKHLDAKERLEALRREDKELTN